MNFSIKGHIVDALNSNLFAGEVFVSKGKIQKIKKIKNLPENAPYIMPGFVDAHLHTESSMLTPAEFGRLAVAHGTVGCICDPHEIANVLGVEGVFYMLQNAKKTACKCFFGAPSCVPATNYETAGNEITLQNYTDLFKVNAVFFLSEMMNYPGVIFNDPQVMAKIALAKQYNKPIDGHAPALRGNDLTKYISVGISTDHECFTLPEAIEKIEKGMKIIIREGSAAKNFNALHPLFKTNPDKLMFCSDDKHPDDLVRGHINLLVKRALNIGYPWQLVLKAACVHPVKHYKVNIGLLQPGDAADFILVDNLTDLTVLKTYINGELVAENGKSLLPFVKETKKPNFFKAKPKQPGDFKLQAGKHKKIRVIEAIEGQLITNELILPITNKSSDGCILADPKADILKIAVVNRYSANAPIAVGFIRNFGLTQGAIAASVAHDSHNIVVVGVSDEDICEAVNLIIVKKGGLAVTCAEKNIRAILPLPLAGIMTTANGFTVAKQYTKIDKLAKQLGTKLSAPFMTLSFMALLVIPSLKLSDKGLFNGQTFSFTAVLTD